MELKQQIEALSSEVEALEAVIDRLPLRVAEILRAREASQSQRETEQKPAQQSQVSNRRPQSRVAPSQPSAEHKDVLVDEIASSRYSTIREQDLAPELQLQRLTAQLTSAYQRIAALEAQLLAQQTQVKS
ncbi:hypothetical protein [Leptolyngbya sp. FACHB-261]|uniref:hypothetical protein n=1 Tax=Leptolyngbya sp. FACHB-261 TaxID=2692806 RepID=UPI001688EC0C|nr:hypothetical protein [Leptolyngbya sp. FACHB-261]MBD2103660.1 hypothetical protein [Leptolyngbya sp. FACHB-261]